MEEGGGSAGVNDPADDGGGPAGVVEGFEGRPLGDFAKMLIALWPEPGVEGACGLEESGTVQDMMLAMGMRTILE